MIHTFFLKLNNISWNEVDERLLAHISAKRAAAIAAQKQDGPKRLSLYSALLTRFALSNILNVDAGSLEFVMERNQKPRLKNESLHVDFSFSHTKDAVLLAICDTGSVGADIENYKIRRTPFNIMKRFFSDAERAYVDEGLHEQSLCFYECWTSKEAFLKKNGIGLGTRLSEVNTLDENISRSIITWCEDSYVCSICTDVSSFSKPLSKDALNITHLDEERLRNHIQKSALFR